MDELFAHVPREMPPLYIDMELPTHELSESTRKEIKALEPYGEGNPMPIFLSEELKIEHREVRYGRARIKAGNVDMLCWDERCFEHLKEGKRVRVAYSVINNSLNIIDVEERHGAG